MYYIYGRKVDIEYGYIL